jgi:transglutaminase-like putative cysteine protease
MTTMDPDFQQYLQATEYIDFHHPAVKAFFEERSGGAATPKEKAVKLYYAVRDEIRYDPYLIDLSVDGLRASTTLKNARGWCVPKAALLAACCRGLGIPAKLGYADVKNHLSTARMREHMKTDLFIWHGYTSIYLEGRWVKATPAFNIELCERFRLKPLEFDGSSDSLYHPFDLLGNKHMEYVRERGEFADVPLDQISRDFEQTYRVPESLNEYDFQNDVERENPAE